MCALERRGLKTQSFLKLLMNDMKIIVKNGYIINPALSVEGTGNILIENGRIVWIRGCAENGQDADSQDARVIEAGGLLVLPGLLDMHTHLREPGFENKETIKTGSAAALHGGFTAVCCMPNTNPPNDSVEVTKYILDRAAEAGLCRVFPIGAITKGQQGVEPVDFEALCCSGCVAFSDDGKPVMNSLVMRKALEFSQRSGVPIISHCEDSALAEGGVMNEGRLSASLGVRGIPAAAEEIMIARDSILAGLTGGKLHIAHVSTKNSVELIRRAKNDGINITAETCPHYFSITERAVRFYGTYAKVNPPLRTEEDVEAIKEGLRDGTIDVIATDHAPHHADEKALDFETAPFGISGLETALGLSLGLVNSGLISPRELVEKMTINPARILGLERGILKEGSEADILIVDPNEEWRVSADGFTSMGRNTPFAGCLLKGRAVMVISGGAVYDVRNGKEL
jgi:dihydroorotase